RAVVDDDDFNVPVGLAERALDLFGQEMRLSIARNDDRDERAFGTGCLHGAPNWFGIARARRATPTGSVVRSGIARADRSATCTPHRRTCATVRVSPRRTDRSFRVRTSTGFRSHATDRSLSDCATTP